jgi:hypothetical protein
LREWQRNYRGTGDGFTRPLPVASTPVTIWHFQDKTEAPCGVIQCSIRSGKNARQGQTGIDGKWQVLGLSLMMLSQTNEEFFDFVKQEFCYIWDGKSWIKEVSYQ